MLEYEFGSQEQREEMVAKIQQSRPPEETRAELKRSLGDWFTDYIMYVNDIFLLHDAEPNC